MTTRKKPIVEPTSDPISEPVLKISVEQTLEKVKIPPIAEKLTPPEIKEPEIINSFYDAIGIAYCKKCGETKRTDNDGNTFCPASKANCSGLST